MLIMMYQYWWGGWSQSQLVPLQGESQGSIKETTFATVKIKKKMMYQYWLTNCVKCIILN